MTIRSNGCSVRDVYARVSKVSVDSFDSSSTSSGESYENTRNYDNDSEPLQSHTVIGNFDPSPFSENDSQPYSAQTTNPQQSGGEDPDAIYSPVSPDCDSSTEDEYDDIDG